MKEGQSGANSHSAQGRESPVKTVENSLNVWRSLLWLLLQLPYWLETGVSGWFLSASTFVLRTLALISLRAFCSLCISPATCPIMPSIGWKEMSLSGLGWPLTHSLNTGQQWCDSGLASRTSHTPCVQVHASRGRACSSKWHPLSNTVPIQFCLSTRGQTTEK